MPSHGDRLLDSICSFLSTGEYYQRQLFRSLQAAWMSVSGVEWNVEFVFTDTDSVTDFVFTFKRYLLIFLFLFLF